MLTGTITPRDYFSALTIAVFIFCLGRIAIHFIPAARNYGLKAGIEVVKSNWYWLASAGVLLLIFVLVILPLQAAAR